MRIAAIVITGAALLVAGTPAMARHHHRHHHQANKLDPENPKAGSVNGPASMGAGTGENKPSATGGQPGGAAGRP